MQARSILVIGNYGAGNLGDDAIFGGILTDLKAIGYTGKVTVMHGGQNISTDIYKGIKKVPFVPFGFRSRIRGISKDTLSAIRNADLVILGGGGLFTDQESFFAPMLWATQIKACKRLNKPYICYGQSVGPLKHWLNRYITQKVFKHANGICVRDPLSKLALERLGIKNVILGTDLAFSWLYELKKMIKPEGGSTKTLLISLRFWPGTTQKDWEVYLKELKILAKKKNLKPILLAMDLRNKKELKALRQTGLEVFEPSSALGAFTGILRSKMLVSMRLHACIMAITAGTKFLAIAYSQKVSGLLNSINKRPQKDLEAQISKNQDFLSQAIDLL